jgi:hypothetical protein
VQEILTNAVRHADATTGDIALERRDGAVLASVRDDGVGIGSAPPRTGLSGMMERALLVGGELSVADTADGGTEVRLRMPVPLVTRILLADDHTVVRRGLRMVLDAAPDLEVVAEAADGVEAVEHGLRDDLDLAVLDVAMPRRTGLHAARELGSIAGSWTHRSGGSRGRRPGASSPPRAGRRCS